MTAPISPHSLTVLPADHESDIDFSLTRDFGITHTLVRDYLTSDKPELLFDLLNKVPYDNPDVVKYFSMGNPSTLLLHVTFPKEWQTAIYHHVDQITNDELRKKWQNGLKKMNWKPIPVIC